MYYSTQLYILQDSLGPIKCVLIREVSSFQGANKSYCYEVGTQSSVLIREQFHCMHVQVQASIIYI